MLTAQIVKRKIVKYDNLSISEPGDLDAAVLLNVYMGTENKLNDQRNNNINVRSYYKNSQYTKTK